MVTGHSQRPTRALVLAAGNGRRLQSPNPKPLQRLLGVPLLARTLFALERAGITEAYVVVGYEGDRVQAEIESIRRLGIRVHWLRNEEWRQPNGLSALAAESVLDEPFILTMADHVFDPEIVTLLRDRVEQLEGIDLAVDYNVERVRDLADATKVRIEDGRIVAIGKDLDAYDAIDTGVFLASPALFDALREAAALGRASLSDGVQRLADDGMARVTDIGDRLWHDIDTPEDLAEAERKLLASVRKQTDGPVARFINRPVSIAMSRRLVNTAVTPNQISVMTLAIGLLAAWLAAQGGYVPMLLAGALFHFASVLDGTDGEVAKLTFRTSRRGEWIDTACDQLTYVAFLIGLLVGVYRTAGTDTFFWLGVMGFVSALASMISISVYLARQRSSGSALSIQYGFQRGTGWMSRALRVLQYFGKRDLFAFLALLLAAVGQLPLGLALFGVGVTLFLLPATVHANLTLRRRQRAARPRREPRTTEEPVWHTPADGVVDSAVRVG